jgi:flavin reductase (DIM6/NTAB) family NADH-FMN oxidoreductase RutF
LLPDWPIGTVTVLSTAGGDPHAIPVSAALRVSANRVLIALAARRGSLARIRADPRVALTILSGQDVAVTANGTARVVDEQLVDGVVAVAIEVDRVQDHATGAFSIDRGVSWRWTDSVARARDAEVHSSLRRLAASC